MSSLHELRQADHCMSESVPAQIEQVAIRAYVTVEQDCQAINEAAAGLSRAHTHLPADEYSVEAELVKTYKSAGIPEPGCQLGTSGVITTLWAGRCMSMRPLPTTSSRRTIPLTSREEITES